MQGSWKLRGTALALVLATLTIGAATAMAHRHGERFGHGFGLGQIERGIGQLGLAADKQEAALAVLAQARSEESALRDQIRAAHEQMRATLDQDSPSLDAVLASADAIGALETQAKKAELQAIVQLRKMLTPEQWQQLRAQHGPGRHGGCGKDKDEEPT